MSEQLQDKAHRVNRGGSWDSNVPSWVRAAFRSPDVPAYRSYLLGFRCSLRGRQPLRVAP